MTIKRYTVRGIRPTLQVRGVVQTTAFKDGRLITKAWPTKRGKPKSEIVRQQNDLFKRANASVRLADPEEMKAAQEHARGTILTWHDILMMTRYGTWLQARDLNGLIWSGIMVAYDQAQALLDALGRTPGQVLYRGLDDWIALNPPTTLNQVIVYIGPPNYFEWQNQSGGGGGGGIAPNFGQYDPPDADDYTLHGTNSTDPEIANVTGSGMVLKFGASPAAGNNVRLATLPAPSSFPRRIIYSLHGIAAGNRFKGFGMALHGTPQGAGGRQAVTCGLDSYVVSGIGYGPAVNVTEWTNLTTFGSTVSAIPPQYPFNYLCVDLTSTTYQFKQSLDALTWVPITGVNAYNSFMTLTDVGLFVHVNNQDAAYADPAVVLHATYKAEE